MTHIFVHLVVLRDGLAKLPAKTKHHAQELLDYMWDDELSDYQSSLESDLDDRHTIEHDVEARISRQ